MNRLAAGGLLALIAAVLAGCASARHNQNVSPTVRYVGSSTIANFIRDAEPVYGRARFVVDTEPESAGGEFAIVEGRADLAGMAGCPKTETLKQGVTATLIAHDAIAVVVNTSNPISDLTRPQLRDIFTGKIRNWKGVGGPDLPIRCFIVGPASATQKVFRSVVLGEAGYAGCEVVRPDAEILAKVHAEPGAIGQISFSFLGSCGETKLLAVDGEQPVPANAAYPITRPLYLLWWPGRARVADFVGWSRSAAAEPILLHRFAKARETACEGRLGEHK